MVYRREGGLEGEAGSKEELEGGRGSTRCIGGGGSGWKHSFPLSINLFFVVLGNGGITQTVACEANCPSPSPETRGTENDGKSPRKNPFYPFQADVRSEALF